MTHQAMSSLAAMAAGFAVLGGCALHAAPTQELASGEHAIAAAQDAGAARLAPAELALAREKLLLGRRWAAAGDYEPARWLAEQALVDSELAAMKSHTRSSLRAVSLSGR